MADDIFSAKIDKYLNLYTPLLEIWACIQLLSLDALQSDHDAAFWNDFGKGFKIGFGGVMDGFGQISAPISAAVPGAGEILLPVAGIGHVINQGVQAIPINFELMQLEPHEHNRFMFMGKCKRDLDEATCQGFYNRFDGDYAAFRAKILQDNL